MQHIVYVITQSSWGGAQRYVADLATHLPRDRYRVTVIVGDGDGALTRVLAAAGVTVHTVRSLKRSIHPWHDLRAFFVLRRLFRSLHPDVVHLNSTKAGALGALAARAAGVSRILFTAHGFVFEEPRGWVTRLGFRLVERVTLAFVQTIITVSEADRQAALAQHIVSADRLRTIHNGITLESEDALSRSDARASLCALGVPCAQETPLIGCIANCYPTKDLGTVLRAAQRVHAEFPTASIVVIGEGRMRPQLEELRKNLGLTRVVNFVGAIPDAWKYWRAFDCAVLSSVKEGLPYTLVEAAVLGVPIVATHVGGIPEIVRDGEHGILVPRRDPEALANAMLRVLRDPSWKQRAEAAAPTIREHFSLERMVRETSEMYGR